MVDKFCIYKFHLPFLSLEIFSFMYHRREGVRKFANFKLKDGNLEQWGRKFFTCFWLLGFFQYHVSVSRPHFLPNFSTISLESRKEKLATVT